MLKPEEISRIKEIWESIANNISPLHKKNIFLSSKGWDGENARFIVYAFGGQLTNLTIKRGNKDSCTTFSKRYNKYFETEDRGKSIRSELAESNKHRQGVRVLTEWKNGIWEEICNAFSQWATKNQVERKRQTFISKKNENKEIAIFAIEENVPLPSSGNGELDMGAIRFENGKPILSLIEYKCTEDATDSKTDFAKHVRDMKKYYRLPEYKHNFLNLYKQKQLLLGNNADVDEKECSVELVLLISHVNWKDSFKNSKEPYVEPGTLLRKLKDVQKINGFKEIENDLKVMIIKDEKEILRAKNYMTYKEALKFIKDNM